MEDAGGENVNNSVEVWFIGILTVGTTAKAHHQKTIKAQTRAPLQKQTIELEPQISCTHTIYCRLYKIAIRKSVKGNAQAYLGLLMPQSFCRLCLDSF